MKKVTILFASITIAAVLFVSTGIASASAMGGSYGMGNYGMNNYGHYGYEMSRSNNYMTNMMQSAYMRPGNWMRSMFNGYMSRYSRYR